MEKFNTNSWHKFLSVFIFGFIFVIVFMMNYWQLPIADEWYHFKGIVQVENIKQVIDILLTPYFGWNARLGEMIFPIFMNFVHPNIFIQQKIFGIINPFVIFGLLLNIFYIIRGWYPKCTKKDTILFICIFVVLHYSGHFNESFIWEDGALNYGWTLFFYSCLSLPYRSLFDKIKENHYSKNIVIFNFKLLYKDNYFSLKETMKGLLFLILSIPIGMGSEITTPVILVGLAIYTIYLVFIRKFIPPLWFFMGGIGLFSGFILFCFAPGTTVRVEGYGMLPESFDIVRLLSSFIKNLYSRSYVYWNWVILGIFIILNKKEKTESSQIIFIKIFISLFLLGMFVLSIFPWLAERMYILVTIFLAIASSKMMAILLEKHTKGVTYIALLLLCIISLDLRKYYHFNTLHKGYFEQIETQKSKGIKNIKLAAEKLDPIFGLNYFYHSDTTRSAIAHYFQVESLELIFPDSEK